MSDLKISQHYTNHLAYNITKLNWLVFSIYLILLHDQVGLMFLIWKCYLVMPIILNRTI